jgi:hypothetical protein
MRRPLGMILAIASLGLVLGSASAHAQWVMVAKAVSGRVQQMSHKPADGGDGFDVATVVLEAPADKVYSTALNALKTHAGITVTQSDDKKRQIEFTNGTQVASLQAQPLGDKISQLVIASTLTPSGPTATSLVLQGVMKVCADMKVACTVEGN